MPVSSGAFFVVARIVRPMSVPSGDFFLLPVSSGRCPYRPADARIVRRFFCCPNRPADVRIVRPMSVPSGRCPYRPADVRIVRPMSVSSEILLFMGCAQNLSGGCSPGPNLVLPQLCLGCCRMGMPERGGAWCPPPRQEEEGEEDCFLPAASTICTTFQFSSWRGGGHHAPPRSGMPIRQQPKQSCGSTKLGPGEHPPERF